MADKDSKSPPAAAKKPRAAPPAGPSMYSMLVDAITSLNDRKGASLPAIKSYIIDKHPEADNAMLRSRLKKALAKGMEKGVICRPKAAESAGTSMTGRFRLDKTALAKETKPKKAAAEKPKKKPEKKTTEKKKKTSTSKSPKATKKTTKSAKSPKSPKAKTAKSKTAKSPKAKKTAEKKKTKSPSAKKSVAKTKKATDKTKKPKAKTTKKTPTKKAKAK